MDTVTDRVCIVPIRTFRTFLAELDAVVTGLATLTERRVLLDQPEGPGIAASLKTLLARFDLDQMSLWRLEANDIELRRLIESLGDPMVALPAAHGFLDRVRRLLSMLSHIAEISAERDAPATGDIVVSEDVRAKALNRALLATEAALGRTVLRSAPLRHVVHTTTRCNLRCLTCFQSINQDVVHHDISDTNFAAMLPAVRLAQQVMVAGTGEPLLSRAAAGIIGAYKQTGTYVELITNGTTFWRTTRLLAAVDVVLLSFDGGTRESYNAVRRWGDFDRLVGRLAEWNAAQRRKVCLNFVVTRQNIYTAPECIALATRLGLGQVHFQEMTAYLPWHDRMLITEADRRWFFAWFASGSALATTGGVRAISHMVPPEDAHAPPPPDRDALTRDNIAAMDDAPVADIPQKRELAAIATMLDRLLLPDMPPLLAAMGRRVRDLATSHPQPPGAPTGADEMEQVLNTERAALRVRVEAGEAVFPHCLSTYAQILVNEDGTTRSCCKVQSRLATLAVTDFSDIRNSPANIELRTSHAIQAAPRAECIGCVDPLRFHFLPELLEELKRDGVSLARIRKPADFPLPASVARHKLVLELGSAAGLAV